MPSRIIRFLLVGVASTLIHVGTAYGLSRLFDLGIQISNIVGFTAAFFLSFLGHRKYTFNVNDRQGERILRFFCTSLFGLISSSFILYVTTSRLMLPVEVGFISVVVIVPLTTYLLSLLWVFKPAPDNA